MADRELGIIIKAKDMASKAVKAIGKEMGLMGKSAQKAGVQTKGLVNPVQALGAALAKTTATQRAYVAGMNRMRDAKAKMVSGIAAAGTAVKNLRVHFMAAAAALAGMIYIITKTVGKFAELEKAMAFVNTIARKSQMQLGYMTNQVREMSKEFGKSAVKLSKSLYDIYSNLGETGRNMDLLRTAAKASVAGFVDMEVTGAALTGVFTSMNIAASKSAEVLDIQFKTIERGKITYAELAKSSGMFLATAASVNQTYGTAMGLFATLTKTIGSTERAATYLNGVFATLIKPETADKLKKAFGVDWVDPVTKEYRDIIEVFKEMKVQVEAMSGPTAAAKFFEVFPEREAMMAVISLFKNWGMTIEDNIAVSKDFAGAWDGAFDKMKNTTSFHLDKMKARWDEFLTEVGASIGIGIEAWLKTIEGADFEPSNTPFGKMAEYISVTLIPEIATLAKRISDFGKGDFQRILRDTVAGVAGGALAGAGIAGVGAVPGAIIGGAGGLYVGMKEVQRANKGRESGYKKFKEGMQNEARTALDAWNATKTAVGTLEKEKEELQKVNKELREIDRVVAEGIGGEAAKSFKELQRGLKARKKELIDSVKELGVRAEIETIQDELNKLEDAKKAIREEITKPTTRPGPSVSKYEPGKGPRTAATKAPKPGEIPSYVGASKQELEGQYNEAAKLIKEKERRLLGLQAQLAGEMAKKEPSPTDVTTETEHKTIVEPLKVENPLVKESNDLFKQRADILNNLQAAYSETTATLADQKDEVANLNAEIQNHNDLMGAAQQDISIYTQKQSELKPEIDKLKQAYSDLSAEYSKYVGKAEPEKKEKKRYTDLKKKISEVESELKTLEGIEESYTNAVKAATTSIVAESTALITLKDKLEEVSKRRELDIALAQDLAAAGDNRIKKAEAEIKSIEREITNNDLFNRSILERIKLQTQLGKKQRDLAEVNKEEEIQLQLANDLINAGVDREKIIQAEIKAIHSQIDESKTLRQTELEEAQLKSDLIDKQRELTNLRRDEAEALRRAQAGISAASIEAGVRREELTVADTAYNIEQKRKALELERSEILKKAAADAVDKNQTEIDTINAIAQAELVRVDAQLKNLDEETDRTLSLKQLEIDRFEIRKLMAQLNDPLLSQDEADAIKVRLDEIYTKQQLLKGLRPEEIFDIEQTRKELYPKKVYLNFRNAISDAIVAGIESGSVKNAFKALADAVKQAFTRKIADSIADGLMGGMGGGIFGGSGGAGGKGGGFGGLLGGGLGGILGTGALIFGLSSLFGDKGQKPGIARPEPTGPKYDGSSFGGERPLYGSQRMQLAQFSSRNIGGALHRMAAEGPGLSVDVTINDKGNFQKEVVTATVKQAGRERRRGPRRHEY